NGEAGEFDDVKLASRLSHDGRGRLVNQFQALFYCEQGGLVVGGADADNQPVAERCRMLDHVQVPVGHRVKRAREEADAGHRASVSLRGGWRQAALSCPYAEVAVESDTDFELNRSPGDPPLDCHGAAPSCE